MPLSRTGFRSCAAASNACLTRFVSSTIVYKFKEAPSLRSQAAFRCCCLNVLLLRRKRRYHMTQWNYIRHACPRDSAEPSHRLSLSSLPVLPCPSPPSFLFFLHGSCAISHLNRLASSQILPCLWYPADAYLSLYPRSRLDLVSSRVSSRSPLRVLFICH